MRQPDGGVETELKFQVPAGRLAALERALATRSAERVALRAVYYDTVDRRLAGARMVLRVRREGDHWVQALKGVGDGLMQRLEDQVPLPAALDPPAPDPARHEGTAAGRSLVSLLEGRALQPVHGTDILRLRRVLRHGGARVEAALDVGVVRAGDAEAPVCELELELQAGPIGAMFELAARWAERFGLVLDVATKSERAQWLAEGASLRPVVRGTDLTLPRGLPLGEARARMLRSTLAHALPNAAAITAGAHAPEHMHQLRVALRRMRTVLRAFGPVHPERDAALGGLFAALGATRDADVLAVTLAPAWAAAALAGMAPLPVDAPRADAGPAALREPAVTQLWLQLLALAQPDPADDRPWDSLVLARLGRWRRSARRMAAEWADLDDPARHRLRKRLKRLRYLLEFALPLLPPKRARRELALLRPLQEALGQWNDLVVARHALAGRDDAASAFAAGWLARQAAEAEQHCRSAAAAWRVARGGLRSESLRAG